MTEPRGWVGGRGQRRARAGTTGLRPAARPSGSSWRSSSGAGVAASWDATHDNTEAAAAELARTARVIDATVVRPILVPATMTPLGDANWWLPRWLDRILPHLDIEGPPSQPTEIPA